MDSLDNIPLPEKLALESQFKASLINVVRGGLGIVYVFDNGEHVHPRFIAAKTFNPRKVRHFGKERALNILRREAVQWFNYGRHPLVLRPLRVEVVSGWPYILMPYRADTLRAFIRGDRKVEFGLSFAIEMCHGLSYARTCGLIAHQDLKPENILIRDLNVSFQLPEDPVLDKYIQIADFGLANAKDDIGLKDGENPYMAPEQFASSGVDFSKVDVFALGVIFTEMFSGKHPTGRSTDEIDKQEWRDASRWHYWSTEDDKLDPSIKVEPPEVKGLIEQMLLTEATERPTLSEVKEELSVILSRVAPDVHEQTLLWTGYFDTITREDESRFITEEREFAENELSKIDPSKAFIPGT